MEPIWAVPFAGLLLSIAIGPLLNAHLWHRHFGKVTAVWSLALLLPFTLSFGVGEAVHVLAHVAIGEYLPFTILVGSLFTIAGGFYVRGNLHGSPGMNVGLMALGAVLASFMGTTGASLLLIQPLIRANDNRRHNVHVVVFFIIIVGNVAGALTPLGDPPLFLGFLQGVPFFWPLQALWQPTLFLTAALLGVFWVLDARVFRREGVMPTDATPDDHRFGVEGLVNLMPLGAAVGLVLMSGLWKPGVSWDVLGTPWPLQAIVRDLGLLACVGASLALTPAGLRDKNRFSWAPLSEVVILFSGIFLTMAPALALLKSHAAQAGDLAPLAYFWLTGLLSSVLDNAPTYLAFFNLAGGDVEHLTTHAAPVLAAISAGAVYLGALTYIGNAPNLLVKAIAQDRGIQMPSFFGYMLWSGAILLPLLLLTSWIWFR